jgi:hypothetical protein
MVDGQFDKNRRKPADNWIEISLECVRKENKAVRRL